MHMNLLVTTPTQIILVDLGKRTTELVRSGDGEYFGMSWNNEVIALTHSNRDSHSLIKPEDVSNSPLGYIGYYANGNNIIKSEELLIGPHQLMMYQDYIVVTNTGRNAIDVFDLEGKLVRTQFYSGLKWDLTDNGKEGNHINSLYETEGRLYAIAHNNSRKSEIWEIEWPSLERLKIIPTDTEWAHNFWQCEHGRIICNSRYGSLYEVESGKTVWQANEEKVVTRGLASTTDYIFIGRSEYGNRIQRRHNHGGIWVVDRASLKTIDLITLPFSGCVNDIRLVGVQDDCHQGKNLAIDRIKYIRASQLKDRLIFQLKSVPLFTNYFSKLWKVGSPP